MPRLKKNQTRIKMEFVVTPVGRDSTIDFDPLKIYESVAAAVFKLMSAKDRLAWKRQRFDFNIEQGARLTITNG
jgi:hypothetical protein